MADQKITDLGLDTSPTIDDLLVTVDSPGGSPVDKKITVGSLIGLMYPVGSIYTSTVATDPGTLFGVGTWTTFGAGKVLVSLDSGDPDFDTAEETGGVKTQDLSHAHSFSSTHSHPLSSNGRAEIYLSATKVIVNQTADTSWSRSISGTTTASSDSGVATNSTILTGNTDSGTASGTTGVSGNTTESIVQPYIVVYCFKRTA